MPVDFYTRNEHLAEDEPDDGEQPVWSAIATMAFLVAFLLVGAWFYHLARAAGW